MPIPNHPVDRILTLWRCTKCGETSECHVSDLTDAGIPMCSDCGDDMDLGPFAVLEPLTPGPAQTASKGFFDSLSHVDWDLLHDQKRALLGCIETKQVTSIQAEALGGIVHLLDALQDDAAAAGLWAFPDEPEGGA